MRLAFAKAGLWFFGVILFMIVILGDSLKDLSDGEAIFTLLFIGVIAAGIAFFWTWHEIEQENRKLELKNRRERTTEGEEAER